MLQWSQMFVIYLATARGFPPDVKFLTFLLQCKVGDTVNNTNRSFLIDVIIRNQDIKEIK
jgi:hypothetical protein